MPGGIQQQAVRTVRAFIGERRCWHTAKDCCDPDAVVSPSLLLVVAAAQSATQLVFSLSSVAGITAVISATDWLESLRAPAETASSRIRDCCPF